MAMVRRILRMAFYAALVVVAAAIGALVVFTTTERGRANLAGLVSSVASSESAKVQVAGINGIWSGNLTVDHVVLEDREGPWLVLREIEVDWSPLALLSRTFRADRVAVGRIEAARAPLADPDARPQAGGGLSLPVSVDIREIDLPQIALGPALAGAGIAELAASGRVRAERAPLAVEADLGVRRRDGREGSIEATVHFLPGEDRLDLDLRAAEPAGGIIANLLRLPDAPPVNIVVAGHGPLADWSGRGAFNVGGQLVTQLTGRHRFTDEGSRVEAKGDGDFARFVPDRLKPLLAGRTRFDLAGTLTGGGGLDIDTAVIDTDAVHGEARGSLDPEGASDFSLEFTSAGPTVPLPLGSAESPIDVELRSASLRAFGEGRAPMVDIEARLATVATNDTKVDDIALALHSDAFDIDSRSGPVSGTATAARIGLDNPTVAPLIAGRIVAEVEGDLTRDTLTVASGRIASDALKGGFDGKVSLADGSIELNVSADADSAALPAAARPVLGERTTLAVALKRDGDGDVTADGLELSSGPLSASGSASLVNGRIAADLKGALADISPLAKDATGAIALAVTASGSPLAPDVTASLTGDRLVVAGRAVAGLRLDAAGKADAANPAAEVTLAADVAGQPLQGKAVLKTADGRRAIDGLTLSLGRNRIAGDLVLDDAFLPEGKVSFDLPDIGPLAALALETAEGAASGTVTFSKEDGVPQVAVAATSAGITRGDLAVKGLKVDALVADYAGAPAVSGTVSAEGVTSGGTVVGGIAIDLKRDGEWTAFSGGATVKDIPAKAAGRVKAAGGTTTVELASGEASFRGVKASIAAPSTILIADGKTTLEKIVLAIGGGTATVTGSAGEALDISAALAGVPVAVANNFAPGLDAAGAVSGTVKVTGAAASPAVSYDIEASGLQVAQTRGAGLGALAVASSGTFQSNRLAFSADIADGAGLALKGGGTVATAGAPELGLDFSGTVPFSFLSRQMAANGMSLSGATDVSVQVRGPASAPVIGGSVRASGARFVAAQAGIAVNDIALDIALGNGVATVNRLTGKLSSGGDLSAGGTVGIDAASGFPADLTLKLTDGRYTDGRVVTANLAGDLALKGQLTSSPVLSGVINLARTVITVPNKLPGSLSELDVQHKNAPAAVRRQDQALRPPGGGASGSGAVSLDLTINAPNEIFVQGRGVDAELGGSLKLAGPTSSPQAVGQFTLRRGRLEILGKRLNFTEGSLSFSGSLVPYLNLVAESTASDATVTVTVSGEATNPKFTFASVPALPEDEVLARLIFGRSMSNLSPLQIAQLASAAAQLAGVGGSTSLLQNLRNAIGIDDLDVTTDDQGGTAVSAGKYLNDRTYLSLEKGEKPGSGKARIDLDVGRGLKLRGEASDAGEAKGGIFFEREY